MSCSLTCTCRALATALAVSASACAHSSGASCDLVYAASDKLLQTPYHEYFTEHLDVPNHGLMHELGKGMGVEHMTSETIFAGGVMYDQSPDGRWQRSKFTVEIMRKMNLEGRNTADVIRTCQYLRDEAVDGETAAVYEIHSKDTKAGVDGQSHMWISKSSGLPLRDRVDMGKGFADTRYHYTDVQAPAGVR